MWNFGSAERPYSTSAAGTVAVAERPRSQTQPQAVRGSGGRNHPRLSVCLEAVFHRTRPFEARLDEVRQAGVDAFEFWSWGDKDLNALDARRRGLGLHVANFACERGGPLTLPESAERFVPALRASIDTARRLHCRRMMANVGDEIVGVPREKQAGHIIEALRAGAPLLEESGITLCVEPQNRRDFKDFFLCTLPDGLRIIREVDSPNVRLLYDVYHQQITEGDIINTMTENIDWIGHIHVADVPGRHEPGTGEINFLNVFRAIVQTGYTGYVGFEWWPIGEDHGATVVAARELFEKAMGT